MIKVNYRTQQELKSILQEINHANNLTEALIQLWLLFLKKERS